MHTTSFQEFNFRNFRKGTVAAAFGLEGGKGQHMSLRPFSRNLLALQGNNESKGSQQNSSLVK